MTRPRMIVVAGPPGSGKSTRFPLSSFGSHFFNADDRAAELNSGSYRKIPKNIRSQVNLEFEEWITERIHRRESFAIETTLRSPITFEQARQARNRGFWTVMHFLTAGSVNESVKRVMERSYRGGHSASERLLLDIYNRSTSNLVVALDFRTSGIDVVRIYDNSGFETAMFELMGMRQGKITYLSEQISPWLEELLHGTDFNIQNLRAALKPRAPREG